MTLLWVAIILAVELIGCVSMTKCTKTQNNAQKHNKNDQEPPTQRTDHPLLAADQSETLAEPVLCSQARNALARREREVIFDTDSARVGVNNRCSGCISHVATNFVGELVESDVAIEGFAGSITRKVMKGTLRWKWTDDDGRTNKFLIPDSFYVPHGGARLLSPQHWAQTQKDRKPTFGTGEWTDAEKPKTSNIPIRTPPPRRRHFSGPNGITNPWLGSPNDGIFNQAALPIHNSFR